VILRHRSSASGGVARLAGHHSGNARSWRCRRPARARFGPRLVDLRLFGSRARGEGHAESDLDLRVLIDGLTRDERREVQDLAFDVGCAAKLVLSPLAHDSRQWRQDLPLAIAIDREGVAL
jgi:hypothetical protein